MVQVPSGIAAAESAPDGQPGRLPFQLLDHGTGYLAAATTLDALRRQSELRGTHVRRLSLAGAAWWLTSTPAHPAAGNAVESDLTPWLSELASSHGPVTAVLQPGRMGPTPLRWRPG
jgi:crotonobetainyl-CoA:carnitine CoA-transferase CaiB-like acyl-CoA transferase